MIEGRRLLFNRVRYPGSQLFKYGVHPLAETGKRIVGTGMASGCKPSGLVVLQVGHACRAVWCDVLSGHRRRRAIRVLAKRSRQYLALGRARCHR